VTPLRRRFGMAVTPPLAFACEHRRGWCETDESPPREARGPWDERVDGSTMRKPRPDSPAPVDLTASGYYAAFRSKLPSGDFDFRYQLRHEHGVTDLGDVQWADWDSTGRLLSATTDGRLQIRVGPPRAMEVAWETDLNVFEPDPQPAPSEASRW
jgi:hypothetical protein